MWSILPKKDIPDFISRYPQLEGHLEFIMLQEVGDLVFFPRYFYYNFPHPSLRFHKDPSWKAYQCSSNFNGELRDMQKSLISPIIKKINDPNSIGGILKARPGAGKTVMGVYLGCATNKKTLIILDNSKLFEQWSESVLKFTNNTNVGTIQGSVFDTDHDFVIAMVQTLVSKSKRDLKNYYSQIKSSGFDLILFDECHETSSGPKYAKSSLFLNTKNIIGLSATPFAHGLHKILMANTIGPIISESNEYEIVPEINIVKYDSGLSYKYTSYIMSLSDMMMRRARYNKIILKSEKYMEILQTLNRELYADNHRTINVLMTKEQVNSISGFLENNGIPNIQFYSQQPKVDKKNDKVLVATYKYSGKGFDYSELSSCIIATPLSGQKSLIQVIGRVLRTCKNKKKAKVYILVETGFGGFFASFIPKIIKIVEKEFKCHVNIIDM